jgi:CrcB protein
MPAYLVVFFGAGIGGALRHGVNLFAAWMLGTGFPFGTLAVNVFGSLTMGLLAGYFAFKGDLGQLWRLFLTTGVLGGFTTFSAFSLDAALLWERGDLWLAALYVFGSVAVSIGALVFGVWIVRTLLF